jgi:hypothetical protein
MDCKKIAQIYLESCERNSERDYKYINKKLQLKREVVFLMNDKNCLEASRFFYNYCDKEINSYIKMKEYYDKTESN